MTESKDLYPKQGVFGFALPIKRLVSRTGNCYRIKQQVNMLSRAMIYTSDVEVALECFYLMVITTCKDGATWEDN